MTSLCNSLSQDLSSPPTHELKLFSNKIELQSKKKKKNIELGFIKEIIGYDKYGLDLYSEYSNFLYLTSGAYKHVL